MAAILEEPVEVRRELLERFNPLELEALDREQRDQTDQRADPELLRAAVGVAQHVVEEPVLAIEQLHVAAAHVLHRGCDVDVVLEELRRHSLVDRVVARELERDPHQVEAEHPHPAGRVGLLEHCAARARLAAVDHGDVVEAEEPTLEHVVAVAVDLVDPAREVDQELVEAALEPLAVGVAVADPIHVVDPPHRPRVDRRVEIAELPLVGRQLPTWVLELLKQKHPELILGELRVNQRERHALEREVPCGEPRILPLVGHRHHPHRVQVAPAAVADRAPRRRRRLRRIIAVEPARHVEQVALLAPQEPRQRAALHEPLVGGGLVRGQPGVERVGLGLARGDDRVDGGERTRRRLVGESQAQRDRAIRRHHVLVVQRRLGAAAVGPDRRRIALADRAVERVLGVQLAAGVAGSVGALAIGLVVGEQSRRRRSVQVARSEPVVRRHVGIDGRAAVVGHQAHAARALARDLRLGLRLRPPGPRVAKPQRW